MAADVFSERLAAVRERFIAKLSTRMKSVEEALRLCSHGSPGTGMAIAVAHREMHELCGLAPIVGFVGTGRAARELEQMLLAPVKSIRDPTPDEIVRMRAALDVLRAIVPTEMVTTERAAEPVNKGSIPCASSSLMIPKTGAI